MHGGTQRGAPDRVQALAAAVVLEKKIHICIMEKRVQILLGKKNDIGKKRVDGGGWVL